MPYVRRHRLLAWTLFTFLLALLSFWGLHSSYKIEKVQYQSVEIMAVDTDE